MRLVGHPEVIDEPWFATGHGRAAARRPARRATSAAGSPQRTRDEVVDAFTEAGAAIAPVYNARDLVEDPHVRETEMLTEVAGRRPRPGAAAQRDVADVARRPGAIRFTGRALGADTDDVLGELGFTAERDRRRCATERGRSR